MTRLTGRKPPESYHDNNDRTCRECRGPLKNNRQTRFCSRQHNEDYWSGMTWAGVRLLVFKRDDYICQGCGNMGRHLGRGADGKFMGIGTVKVEADHIVELADGGEAWEMSNIQTLCKECHKAKTSTSRRARAA